MISDVLSCIDQPQAGAAPPPVPCGALPHIATVKTPSPTTRKHTEPVVLPVAAYAGPVRPGPRKIDMHCYSRSWMYLRVQRLTAVQAIMTHFVGPVPGPRRDTMS